MLTVAITINAIAKPIRKSFGASQDTVTISATAQALRLKSCNLAAPKKPIVFPIQMSSEPSDRLVASLNASQGT